MLEEDGEILACYSHYLDGKLVSVACGIISDQIEESSDSRQHSLILRQLILFLV